MTLSRMKSVRGVSMIELMVALIIGSVLIIGAVSVYVQSRATYRTNEVAARLQEVARYSMDILEPDIRLAGFWGLTNQFDYVENRATPAQSQQAVDSTVLGNCGTNFTVNAASFVDARDATTTGGAGYDLDATNCAATDPVEWSDVLIVRRASSNTAALESGRMQIQSNRARATIFSDGVLPALYDTVSSETRNMVVRVYYVSEVLPSPNGVRQFALRRKTLTRDGAAGRPRLVDEDVMPGVEDLQVQFGVDAVAPHDGNVDRYVNPGAVPADARIKSVRIWLRVLAEDRDMSFIDDIDWEYANADYGVLGGNQRRVVISKTIQLRNSPL